MGWPRMAGRGGPRHTRARTYDDVSFKVSNTMFYDDSLHKLVWQRNALALIFRQRNVLALNLGVRVSQKHDTNNNLKSIKWWQAYGTRAEQVDEPPQSVTYGK